MPSGDRFRIIRLLSTLLAAFSLMTAVPMSTTVASDDPDTEPPVASITCSPSGQVGESMLFDGTASTDNIGIVRYFWDFNDGTSGILGNATRAAVVTHAFARGGTYNVTLRVSDAAGNWNGTNRTVVVLPLPKFADLFLSDLAFAPPKLVEGTPVRITVTLGNIGDVPAADFFVRFTDNGKRIRDVRIASIDPGANRTVTADWTPEAGEHTITVLADARSEIPESDESNNIIEADLTVEKPPYLGIGVVPAIVMFIVAFAAIGAAYFYFLRRPGKRA